MATSTKHNVLSQVSAPNAANKPINLYKFSDQLADHVIILFISHRLVIVGTKMLKNEQQSQQDGRRNQFHFIMRLDRASMLSSSLLLYLHVLVRRSLLNLQQSMCTLQYSLRWFRMREGRQRMTVVLRRCKRVSTIIII